MSPDLPISVNIAPGLVEGPQLGEQSNVMVVVGEDRDANVCRCETVDKRCISSLTGSGARTALRGSLVLTESNQVHYFQLNYSPT